MNDRGLMSYVSIVVAALILATVGLPLDNAAAQHVERLTLDEAIQLARDGSPAVLDAYDAVKEAELELDRARGAFKSSVSLSGSVRLDDEGVDSGTGTAQAGGSLGAALSWSARTSTNADSSGTRDSLSVTYQVWPPASDSSNSISLDNAQRRIEAAQYELEIAKATATLNALDSYYKVLLAGERLRLAEELLGDAERALARIEEKVSMGTASTSERITAEIELLERQGDLAVRQSQFDNAKSELARLIGRTFVEIDTVPLEEGIIKGLDVPGDLPTEEEAIQAALDASVQLRARELAVANAKRTLEIALRNNGLGLSLNGGIENRTGGATDWSVRLTGSYALVDGGARRRNVQSAEHALQKAEKAYASTVESIEEQVRGTLRALANGTRTVEIRRNMERLRQLDLSVAQQQAAIGYITDAALRERHRSSRTAMLDRVEAEVSLHLERLRLDLLMGRL